jgi:hypothetical protein
MHNAMLRRLSNCSTHARGKLLPGLVFGFSLAACGGNDYDSPVIPSPTPTPTPTVSNTVVAYPSDAAELKLYAGQSRQLTLSFRTSDGGSASALALAVPASGLPAGWSIGSNRKACELVDAGNLCQVALTYAPATAEQCSVVTFPYSYRNNKGDAATGNIAIAYRALGVNAATAALLPAGQVRGVTGNTRAILLSFGTNDDSPAADLHVDTDLAALPAGWSSPAIGLDCAGFGAKSLCQLALSYTPTSAAPASVLAIDYRYKDSSGKQQTATANIDYSATAPNTVDVGLSPAGVVRARAGASQQVQLTFAPSDSSPASALRLMTDVARLPAGWSVQASTLPCATVDGSGGCRLTLSYAPVPDQPAGKLDIDYAYTDATGRELTGKTTVRYASHDYRVYVTDYGDIVDGEPVGGGVRQCELDGAGKLSACVKVATAWPIFGVSEIVIYGSHAYIGAVTGNFSEINVRPRQITVCNIADDNALVDCAGSGLLVDQLTGLQVSGLGVFVLSVPNGFLQVGYCKLTSEGQLDTPTCGFVRPELFSNGVPYAMTSTDTGVYFASGDRATTQNLSFCTLNAESTGLNCLNFGLGRPEQSVERMSSGQAGGKPYLYLATSSLAAPGTAGGRIFKCAIGEDGAVTGCERGVVPPGLSNADLIRIRDIRIVRNSAWLVTGATTTSAKVYQCQIDQQTGDLKACVNAGEVEGVRNFGIAVR